MEDTIKKAIKTGYGLGLLTYGEAKRVANKVKKDLGLNDKESIKLAKELVANSKKASDEVMCVANKNFESALVKSGLTDKRELKQVKKILKKRIKKKMACKKPSRLSKVKSKVKRKISRKKK